MVQKNSIKQVEITSCGLNPEPLKTNGYEYPATIACIITNGHMPHGCNSIYKDSFPNVSHLGEDRFIAEICADTLIGYKYFDYKGVTKLTVKTRHSSEKNTFKNDGPERIDRRSGSGNKKAEVINSYDDMILEVRLVEDGPVVGTIKLEETDEWTEFTGDITVPDGTAGLFLTYKGNPQIQLLTISL